MFDRKVQFSLCQSRYAVSIVKAEITGMDAQTGIRCSGKFRDPVNLTVGVRQKQDFHNVFPLISNCSAYLFTGDFFGESVKYRERVTYLLELI